MPRSEAQARANREQDKVRTSDKVRLLPDDLEELDQLRKAGHESRAGALRRLIQEEARRVARRKGKGRA